MREFIEFLELFDAASRDVLFLQLQTGRRGRSSKPRHIARPLDESLLPLNDAWHVLTKVGPAREVEMRTRRKSVKSAQAAAFCGATVFAVLQANVLAGRRRDSQKSLRRDSAADRGTSTAARSSACVKCSVVMRSNQTHRRDASLITIIRRFRHAMERYGPQRV